MQKKMIVLTMFFLMLARISIAQEISVCFTPNQDCTEQIAHHINNAKKEILIQAYYFTSVPIAKALLAAKKRGVNINIILDKSQASGILPPAMFFKRASIPVWIDTRYAIAHNKIMILDRDAVITGSFNYTSAAQKKNAENVLFIQGNKSITDKYVNNFVQHRENAIAYH